MPLFDGRFALIALRESVRDALALRCPVQALDDHLRAAMAWLVLAQDKAGNGGVSAGFGRRGWRPDYPETTGYIIPTFLDYFRLTNDQMFLDRAKKMGDYEMNVQQQDGAIPGGYSEPRSPCVFDTGQVIFGWVALFQETRNPAYLQAARRAGDWLLSVQATDGSWPRYDHAVSARAYHSRVAWALVELSQVSGQASYGAGARHQLDWTEAQQQPNGWFARAELRGEPFAVTHTIAYTIRGLLEVGLALPEPRYVAAARRAADQLIALQLADGSLCARYDATWHARTAWRCVTGCAQMALNWLRLYEHTGEVNYLMAAHRANIFVRQTHNVQTPGPVRGAIKGSWPCYGRYERFSYPNWATKFAADAFMLELKLSPEK